MTFHDQTASLIAQAAGRLSGNFSWALLGGVVQQFLIDAMKLAGSQLAEQGHEKKALVMAALSQLLDTLPLPTWLALLRVPLKSLLLHIADGAIEAIYLRFQEQISHE